MAAGNISPPKVVFPGILTPEKDHTPRSTCVGNAEIDQVEVLQNASPQRPICIGIKCTSLRRQQAENTRPDGSRVVATCGECALRTSMRCAH